MDAAIQYIEKQPYNLRYRLTEYMNRWLVPKLIKKEDLTDEENNKICRDGCDILMFDRIRKAYVEFEKD